MHFKNSINMDKNDLVLDIIGNPGKYSAEEIKEILSDPETLKIYNLLCETVSTVGSQFDMHEQADVDREWINFSRRHSRGSRLAFWGMNRAASIAVLLISALAAVAIGVAVTLSITGSKPASDPRTASHQSVSANERDSKTPDGTITAENDSVAAVDDPILFEDVPLQTILFEVGKIYGVEVRYNNRRTASLHLYYRLDPHLSLDEIIRQLNNFDQINISREGNTINID